jgi:hypothetical protein
VRAPVSLPLGLPVVLALTAAIDTDKAAAGDPVAATVSQSVRRPGSSTVLLPAGATVRGRLTRLEHHVGAIPYFLIAMSFNRVELPGGALAPFAARLETDPDLVRRLGAIVPSYGGGIVFWDVGTLLLPSGKSHYVLPAGFAAKWVTLATRSR